MLRKVPGLVIVAISLSYVLNCAGSSDETTQSEICKRFAKISSQLTECDASVEALDVDTRNAVLACMDDPEKCTPEALDAYLALLSGIVVEDSYQNICNAAKRNGRYQTTPAITDCTVVLSNSCAAKTDLYGVMSCINETKNCASPFLSRLTEGCLAKASELFSGFALSPDAGNVDEAVTATQELCAKGATNNRLKTSEALCVADIQDNCPRDELYTFKGCLNLDTNCKLISSNKVNAICLKAVERNFTNLTFVSYGDNACSQAETKGRLVAETKDLCANDIGIGCSQSDEIFVNLCLEREGNCSSFTLRQISSPCISATQKHFAGFGSDSQGNWICRVAQEKSRIVVATQDTCAADMEVCTAGDSLTVQGCIGTQSFCASDVFKTRTNPPCLEAARKHITLIP